MLPCICSVIDHRWCQNVVMTKRWHKRRSPSVSLMFLPHFNVFCDLLLNKRTATKKSYLFYMIKKQTHKKLAISKSFKKNNSKTGPLRTLTNTKLSVWRNLLSMKNEPNWLVAMHRKELWLVQGSHTTESLEPLESSIACCRRKLTVSKNRKIHCLTSEFHVEFHLKNRYHTHHFAIRAISVFRVKFNMEFTRQAVNFSIVLWVVIFHLLTIH